MTAPHTPRRTRRTGVVVATIVAVVVAAVGSALAVPSVRRLLADPAGGDPVAGVAQVAVVDDAWQNHAFAPPVIEVAAGTTVTWSFEDGEDEHNVVFDDVASPTQATGTWDRTFDEPGSHPYTCTLDSNMDGRVEVTP